MKLWLLLASLGYLFWAISTSFDKYMMAHKYDLIRTRVLKMFFDGIIVLVAGLMFFEINITWSLIKWSLFLGIISSLAGVLYFYALKKKDAEVVVPYKQAGQILLTFIAGIVLFHESANYLNYIGVGIILIGVYAILSKNGFKFPKLDTVIFLMFLLVILDVIYLLLVKVLLFNISAINLVIVVYFANAIFMFVYQLLFDRESMDYVNHIKPRITKIIISAFFGGLGTLLVFMALNIGDASKVLPAAGLQSVFIFVIASLFLKEKFTWHRFFGTIAVGVGILLVSL